MLSIWVLSVIGMFFFIRARQKAVLSYMNEEINSSDGGENDDLKMQIYVDCGLHLNELKGIMYLNIGFECMCHRFLDWSLVRFLTAHHTSNKVMIACTQMVSFFPGESRLLNVLFLNASKSGTLSFSDRFLVYQVYRIKTLRQSSTSIDANERLIELRHEELSLEAYVRSFWQQKESTIGYFEQLSSECKRINGLWQANIRDYPNNSKCSEEYSRFLIECQTDFYAAIVQKQRATLIELGSNFSIDLVFRSLVWHFPDYLKKHIVDTRGNLKLAQRLKKGTQSSSEHENSAISGSLEIDAEQEETIGKTIITSSRLRLALHHAISNHQTTSTVMMPYAAILLFLAAVAANLVIYLYIDDAFHAEVKSMNRLVYLSNVRFNYAVSMLALTLEWAVNANLLVNTLETVIETEDVGLRQYLGFSDFQHSVMYYQYESRNALDDLVTELAALSHSGVNINTMADPMLNDRVDTFVCLENSGSTASVIEESTYKTTLKNSLMQVFYLQSHLTGSNIIDLFGQRNFCEIYLASNSSSFSFDNLQQGFSDAQMTSTASLKSRIDLFMAFIPALLFVLTVIPTLILVIKYAFEVNKLGNALLSTDNTVKQECIKPLRRDPEENELDSVEPSKRTSKLFVLNGAIVLIGLILIVLSIVATVVSRSAGDTLHDMNLWNNYACERISVTAEIINDLMLMIHLQENPASFLDNKAIISKIDSTLDTLKTSNENLLQGSDDADSCYGFDSLLDELNVIERCDDPTGLDDMHNIYKCSSTNQGITLFIDYVIAIKEDFDFYKGRYDGDKIINLIHLTDTHLWERLNAVAMRIIELGLIESQKLGKSIGIPSIAGIIIGFIGMMVCIWTQYEMIAAFNGALSMIKHMPPHQIVQNKVVLSLLLNKAVEKKNEGMSLQRALVTNSSDGIFFTNLSGGIEVVSPACTDILGCTQEQFLGQPITSFFIDNSQVELLKQMELIKSGQSAPFYEGKLICVSDQETDLPCHVTILGMSSKTDIDSFVIILRDETLLQQQQEQAEAAKARSENLLFQILPRDIVVKLNQGQKDISFTVASASVIFIDIVRFSDYASTLTPDQIMGNLSVVFSAMDAILAKHPLLCKIKLIGDVYMAAGGLFSPDEPPVSHAEQTVRFGLEVITELDDINIKLSSNLQVRVGVNTGGPLLAGVLGTDQPAFDIIGDTINVAARLQSTDVPGRIQIPDSTYQLISTLNFEIEERGQVFLKGKGQTMAYFVRPFSNILTQEFSKQNLMGSGYNTASLPGLTEPTGL